MRCPHREFNFEADLEAQRTSIRPKPTNPWQRYRERSVWPHDRLGGGPDAQRRHCLHVFRKRAASPTSPQWAALRATRRDVSRPFLPSCRGC